jgi:hypothetical protein
MSMSRRCDFFLATDGKWYCTLGDFEYADDDCDCTTYGPFNSERAAGKYICDNFSNPGACCVEEGGLAEPPKDAVKPHNLARASRNRSPWRLK